MITDSRPVRYIAPGHALFLHLMSHLDQLWGHQNCCQPGAYPVQRHTDLNLARRRHGSYEQSLLGHMGPPRIIRAHFDALHPSARPGACTTTRQIRMPSARSAARTPAPRTLQSETPETRPRSCRQLLRKSVHARSGRLVAPWANRIRASGACAGAQAREADCSRLVRLSSRRPGLRGQPRRSEYFCLARRRPCPARARSCELVRRHRASGGLCAFWGAERET
ncbi:hypothetical protein OBBRIDRAFT_106311 [Obba rivulosa]|uniref:Uncharacterized protein n=1 Tax=Obba rivulosa TaxID=1052685 RepID=A0A8E2AUC8_9APHY|nr:hypothetical protein OBBRIDRAFT_106311 [Obba rivulosa]